MTDLSHPSGQPNVAVVLLLLLTPCLLLACRDKGQRPRRPQAPVELVDVVSGERPQPVRAAPDVLDGVDLPDGVKRPFAPREQRPEPLATSPVEVVQRVQRLLAAGEAAAVEPYLYDGPRLALDRIPVEQLKRLFKGRVVATPRLAARRAVVTLAAKKMERKVVLVEREGRYRVDLKQTAQWSDPNPGSKDPLNTPISIGEALAGIQGAGRLLATISTSAGDLKCELFERRAPRTVANFVGLARGLRGFRDWKTGAWTRRPFYDDLTIHRVLPGFIMQGGDPRRDGTGGPGFSLADELHVDLRHVAPGTLAMANRGPNTNGSQFYITEVATPWLDDAASVFGRCGPIETIKAITSRPTVGQGRPREPVKILTVTLSRGE